MPPPNALVRAVDQTIAHIAQGDKAPETLTKQLDEVRRLALDAQHALDEAKRELNELSNLYVVHLRLFEDLRPEKVAEALAEIVVNLIGSEDFALYVKRGGKFVPERGMGSAYAKAAAFDLGKGLFGETAQAHEPCYSRDGWLALVGLPGQDGTMPVGFLAIKGLLAHKARLSFEDRELLSVLRVRAGHAMGVSLAAAGIR